jgi:hypothetical protein
VRRRASRWRQGGEDAVGLDAPVDDAARIGAAIEHAGIGEIGDPA